MKVEPFLKGKQFPCKTCKNNAIGFSTNEYIDGSGCEFLTVKCYAFKFLQDIDIPTFFESFECGRYTEKCKCNCED